MEKYQSIILDLKDLYTETHCMEPNPSKNINFKLYKVTITHIPTKLKASHISENSSIHAYNTALILLENKVAMYKGESMSLEPIHLSKEGQEEYNKIVNSLYQDTEVVLF